MIMEQITGYRFSHGKYVVLDTYVNFKTRVPIPKEIRDYIIASVESICENCNTFFPYLEVHHRNHDPSDNDLENLIALCPNCHVLLHKELEEYE